MTAPTNADVLAYLAEEHPRERALVEWSRQVVLAAEPDFDERIYRGWRGLGYRHPEGGYVCGLFPKAGEVRAFFEHGQALHDVAGLFEDADARGRTLVVRAADEETRRNLTRAVESAVVFALLRNS